MHHPLPGLYTTSPDHPPPASIDAPPHRFVAPMTRIWPRSVRPSMSASSTLTTLA